MQTLPKSFKHALGVITLMSIANVSTADPKIISTYKARTITNTEDSQTNSSESTGGTTSTSGTNSTGGSTTGSKGTTTGYIIPSNFNFNCNTRNPKADAIENGRRAYVRLNCNVCHSSTGHGGTMGPSLIGEGSEVAEAVSQGEDGGMPSFKKYLCPSDLSDLKAYIDSLSTKASPDFTDWWVTNPPAPFVDTAP